MNAELQIDVEVLPKEDADADPLEHNVQFSDLHLNRFTWRSAVTRPTKTLKLLIGPTLTLRVFLVMRWVLPVLACIIIALLVVLLTYYVLATVAELT